MQVNEVVIRAGLGGDLRYYLDVGNCRLVASSSSLFQLGLAFYHVSVGNWGLEPPGIGVDVDDLRVYSMSSESSVSSSHQFSGDNPTPRWVRVLLFESRLGDLFLAGLECWLGLGVVCVGDLYQQ